MLTRLKILRFRLKLVKFSERNIQKWKKSKQVDKLEYALIYGNYNSRKIAAEALGEVGIESSIPFLFYAIDDPVKNVSIAALNALDKISKTHELAAIIIKKRFEWLKHKREKDTRDEANKNKPKKYTIYKWQRASKKSFDRVKEQLKKPMR